MATQANKRKGPRPKHVPERTCIACRRVDPKRALVRIVRDAQGRVQIDTGGKQAGRGAYLCHDPACWEQALRRRGLERALRVEALHDDDRAALEQYLQSFAAPDQPSSSATEAGS
ncbi:MAG TPA: YlxR family protein [Roseiflexaceae bacterium]|nr:YlxR family protein [Roseiflexaceae bacterium]